MWCFPGDLEAKVVFLLHINTRKYSSVKSKKGVQTYKPRRIAVLYVMQPRVPASVATVLVQKDSENGREVNGPN